MDKQTKELRSEARLLKPLISIGKDGVTPGVIAQLDKELQRVQLVKVQMRPSALSEESARADRTRIATQLAQECRAQLIDRVGNMIVLYRAKRKPSTKPL